MCSVEGCNNEKILAKGLCCKHYKQIYRHGKIFSRTVRDKNEIVKHDNYAEIILYDKNGEEKAKAIIDLDDIEKCSNYKWSYCNGGYVICESKNILLHRFIINCNKDMFVDHINHNKLDNRKSNLRMCSQQENNQNKGIQSNNTSGCPGVNYRKDRGKWRAYICINGKQTHLGFFNTKEEAIKVRKEAEEKYFGEFRNKELDEDKERN